MSSVNTVLERVMNLKTFKVVTELPDEFEFNGRVPYDMSIKDNMVTMHIPALTLAEAKQLADQYLNPYAS
jgi:hypothetical protein